MDMTHAHDWGDKQESIMRWLEAQPVDVISLGLESKVGDASVGSGAALVAGHVGQWGGGDGGGSDLGVVKKVKDVDVVELPGRRRPGGGGLERGASLAGSHVDDVAGASIT